MSEFEEIHPVQSKKFILRELSMGKRNVDVVPNELVTRIRGCITKRFRSLFDDEPLQAFSISNTVQGSLLEDSEPIQQRDAAMLEELHKRFSMPLDKYNFNLKIAPKKMKKVKFGNLLITISRNGGDFRRFFSPSGLVD